MSWGFQLVRVSNFAFINLDLCIVYTFKCAAIPAGTKTLGGIKEAIEDRRLFILTNDGSIKLGCCSKSGLITFIGTVFEANKA